MPQSIDFELGSTQYCTVEDHDTLNALDNSTTLTVEYWIKHETDPDTTEQKPTSRGLAGNAGAQWEIRHNSGVHFYVNNDNANVFTEIYNTDINGSWGSGAWQHVANVYDEAATPRMLAFLNAVDDNGTLAESGTQTALADNCVDIITIGANETGGNSVDGKMFDFRVWSTARTSTEISDNKDKELAGIESGLVLNILFDGTTTNKVSGGSDGVLVNTPSYSEDTPSGYVFLGAGGVVQSSDLSLGLSRLG